MPRKREWYPMGENVVTLKRFMTVILRTANRLIRWSYGEFGGPN